MKEWCINNLPDNFFKSSEEYIDCYSSIMQWAYDEKLKNRYNEAALNTFAKADLADSWLIAYTMKNDKVVLVTQEKSALHSKKSIKIPDVCSEFDLKCIDVIAMFRALEVRF